MQGVYRSCDVGCLVTVVVRLVILDAIVIFNLTPKSLFVAIGVVFDARIPAPWHGHHSHDA